MSSNREKDLAMLCRRMVHAIRTHTDEDCKARNIIPKVMEYLVRNGLQGSLLREEYTEGWRQLGPEQDKIAPQCAQTTRAFVK